MSIGLQVYIYLRVNFFLLRLVEVWLGPRNSEDQRQHTLQSSAWVSLTLSPVHEHQLATAQAHHSPL